MKGTKMNTVKKVDFTAISEEELKNTNGGFVISVTVGGLIGLGLTVAGLGAGYYFGSK